MQETVANADAAGLTDCRILAGLRCPRFRPALLGLVAALDEQQLEEAIDAQPLPDLWPQALGAYAWSKNHRASEANFRVYNSSFAGRLDNTRHDQVLDAIIGNGQNEYATGTGPLLLSLFGNARPADVPTREARDRLYRESGGKAEYAGVFAQLSSDGWQPT